MSKTQMKYFITAGLFLIFILYTVLVATVDVQEIEVGAETTKIGFAGINTSVHNTLGTSDFWYSLTKYLGYFAILMIGCFGLIGLVQMIKRKNFFRTDTEILVLGAFYVVMAAAYVLFEKVIINYRPVLEDGKLEASYPSSHTMLVCCVMATAIFQWKRLIKVDILVKLATAASVVIIAIMVVGRLLSGVHWITDIVGGVLVSGALVMLYAAAVDTCKEKLRKRRANGGAHGTNKR